MRIMLPSILMILAAGWFAACSDDDGQADGFDMPEEYDTPISFGGEMGDGKDQTMGGAKQRTRAGLEDTHTSFKLWGYKNTTYDDATQVYADAQTVFRGYTVKWAANTANTTSDNTHDWSYVGGTNVDGVAQTVKFWDYSAQAYRFMAYAPADAEVEITQTTDNMEFRVENLDGENESAAASVSHLWFSNDNYPAYPEYGKLVQLVFVKPLCKVRIMFIDSQSAPITSATPMFSLINKNTIAFAPVDAADRIVQKGTFFVAYPLAGTSTTETYSSVPSADGTLTALSIPYEETLALASETKKWYTLLPNREQGAYRMSIVVNNVSRTAVVPEQYMKWLPGYQYTYVFKISDDGMAFQPQFFVYDKWQAGYTHTTEW